MKNENGRKRDMSLTPLGAGTAGNLDLTENPFYRDFTDTIALTSSSRALPDMQGSGAVRDLQEAANDGVWRMVG